MLDYQLLCNERIKKLPLVLCNSLFTISETETDIIGYWQDDTGKVYKDYIKIEKFFLIDNSYFLSRIKTLFQQGEQAVFYKDFYNYGNIRYKDGSFEVLKNRIEILEYGMPSNNYIAKLLEFHGGLTIYKVNNGNYIIEIYK